MEIKVKVALCSFGMSGRVFHAPFYNVHPGFELYAVWERSKKAAQQLYPGVKSYSDFNEILNDKSIHLVVVNTPNTTHHQYAKQALLAGKNVVVEKPFTVTVKEAEELIQIAKQQNLLLTVYHNRRWDSDFKTVKKIVENGVLGEIVDAEIHFDRYSTELSPKVHKEIPVQGTGVLYDLGSHLIDAALQLFGHPHSVFADLRIIRPVSQVIDYMNVVLYYPNLRVHLRSSYLVKEPLPAFILHGSNGSFIKTRADMQEEDLTAGKIPGTNNWGTEPAGNEGILHINKNGEVERSAITTETGNYIEYYNTLYNSIVTGSSLPVKAEEGKQVIQIIEAAMQSSEEQKIIHLK
jgi:scyllo-inositol 2-dehydrogenase (NADP+)